MSILFSDDFYANAGSELPLLTNDTRLKILGAEIYISVNFHIVLGDGGFGWGNNEEKT